MLPISIVAIVVIAVPFGATAVAGPVPGWSPSRLAVPATWLTLDLAGRRPDLARYAAADARPTVLIRVLRARHPARSSTRWPASRGARAARAVRSAQRPVVVLSSRDVAAVPARRRVVRGRAHARRRAEDVRRPQALQPGRIYRVLPAPTRSTGCTRSCATAPCSTASCSPRACAERASPTRSYAEFLSERRVQSVVVAPCYAGLPLQRAGSGRGDGRQRAVHRWHPHRRGGAGRRLARYDVERC